MSTATKAQPRKIPGGLTPLQLHAINIFGKEAAKFRDELAVGEGQKVDFTVRIVGEVSVGDEQPYVKTEKPSPIEALEEVLTAMDPADREAIGKALTRKNRKPRLACPAATELAQRIVDRMTTRTDDTKRGSVVGRLEVMRG